MNKTTNKTNSLPPHFVQVQADVLEYRENALMLGTLGTGVAAAVIGLSVAYDNGFFDFSALKNYLTDENAPKLLWALFLFAVAIVLIRARRVVRMNKITQQFEVVVHAFFSIRVDHVPLRDFDKITIERVKKMGESDRYKVSLSSDKLKRRAGVSKLLSYPLACQQAEALANFLGLPVVDEVTPPQTKWGRKLF